MKPTIAVAISGGIDSLFAAYLLKEQNYNVIGVHFLTGYEKTDEGRKRCNAISKKLEIPLHIVDIADSFKSIVIKYFTDTYRIGKTPNPCLICNPLIKFGILMQTAKQLGASMLATGHYARIFKDNDGVHLLKGVDEAKDQSYFLAFISQKQLHHACFPLGNMKKSEVKSHAFEKGFSSFAANESQDICFIKGMSYDEFLSKQTGFTVKKGLIEDINGNVIGMHNGLHLFTVGQRKGINCPAKEPYYVVRIDADNNKIIVGSKNDLLSKQCYILNVNWIRTNKFPIKASVKLRYRHKPAYAVLAKKDENTILAEFEQPQPAITPGQGAVFYIDDEVIGGGIIN